MSKLAAFLERLAEKKAALDAEGRRPSSSGGSSVSSEGGGAGQPSVYGSKGYWDSRYEDGVIGDSSEKGELSNEWFVAYPVWREHIHNHAARDASVLILGVGLSLLGEDMAGDGYSGVTAMDYSEVCVERLRAEQARRRAQGGRENAPEVAYRVMDVTDMHACADGSLDALVDKATIDTIYNLDGSSAPVERMLAECSRVLRKGGKYICLSYGEPDDRLPMLQRDAWGWELVDQQEVWKNKACFHLYVLERTAQHPAMPT